MLSYFKRGGISSIDYNFNFSIIEVARVDDDKQTITLAMFMYVKWLEPRLQINESSLEWEQIKKRLCKQ